MCQDSRRKLLVTDHVNRKENPSIQITETEEPDSLYKNVAVLVKGHDKAVLDSYQYFATLAAQELGINIDKVYEPPKKIERLTLLKSVHIFKKHRVQYEMRTYYRCIEVAMKNLPKTGFISQVLMQLPHVFQSFMDQETRFQFFIDKVLLQYRDVVMSHTLIYIPSYFDYVRLRNYLRKEELNCTHICEYSKKSEVSRARHFFQKGEKQFLLFTERFHFYKRYTIKGIHNLIFYLLALLQRVVQHAKDFEQRRGGHLDLHCPVLPLRHAEAGCHRQGRAKKSVHLFVTGERKLCNSIMHLCL
ncbi:UNVERIFIED_CONTAM: hypothetical protein FKN15_064440 [Acipenser sinensis]